MVPVMKVGVVSLGCVKNRVDTEQMLHLLVGDGFELTQFPAEADVLLVNTCGFIESAKEESIETIFEMARYKETGKCRVLCVAGCLAQRYPEQLMKDIPEIDCLLGVGQIGSVHGLIRRALAGERPVLFTGDGMLAHRAKIEAAYEGPALFAPAESCFVRPAAAAALAAERTALAVPDADLHPFYLRPPQAVRQRNLVEHAHE